MDNVGRPLTLFIFLFLESSYELQNSFYYILPEHPYFQFIQDCHVRYTNRLQHQLVETNSTQFVQQKN